VPLLLKADRHNRLQLWVEYSIDPAVDIAGGPIRFIPNAIIDSYYSPNQDNNFDCIRIDSTYRQDSKISPPAYSSQEPQHPASQHERTA